MWLWRSPEGLKFLKFLRIHVWANSLLSGVGDTSWCGRVSTFDVPQNRGCVVRPGQVWAGLLPSRSTNRYHETTAKQENGAEREVGEKRKRCSARNGIVRQSLGKMKAGASLASRVSRASLASCTQLPTSEPSKPPKPRAYRSELEAAFPCRLRPAR